MTAGARERGRGATQRRDGDGDTKDRRPADVLQDHRSSSDGGSAPPVTLHAPGQRAKGIGIRTVIAAVALASWLAGCGSKTDSNLDAVHVARSIAASIEQQRHVSAQVTCPTTVPQRAHLRFWCVAEIGSSNTSFLVTERDGSGHVTYVGERPARTPVLDSAKVESAIEHTIEAKTHKQATVQCPSGIPRQSGLPFICTATTAGGATDFRVDQSDSDGHVTYRAR
jgi:hypothetical protein